MTHAPTVDITIDTTVPRSPTFATLSESVSILVDIKSILPQDIINYIAKVSSEHKVPSEEQERLVGYVCLKREVFGTRIENKRTPFPETALPGNGAQRTAARKGGRRDI